MVLLETRSPERLRSPAWLLTLSPVAFIVWLVAVVATMSGTGVEQAADLTAGQMDSIRLGWLVEWPLYAIAVLVGAVGMARLNQAVRSRFSTASQVAVAVSAAAILAQMILSEVAVGFTEARLGDNGAYQAAMVASYTSIWAAAVAIVLTGIGLRTSVLLRRTGLVVAIVAAVFLGLDLLTRAFPPFVVAFLWLAIGVGLLRRRGAE
jgi:hypothetical protein